MCCSPTRYRITLSDWSVLCLLRELISSITVAALWAQPSTNHPQIRGFAELGHLTGGGNISLHIQPEDFAYQENVNTVLLMWSNSQSFYFSEQLNFPQNKGDMDTNTDRDYQ